MIKLHASYGLKVPGPEEFSSESFHATTEIELADNLVNKPDALKAALHSLWDDLKQAVAQEIRRNGGNHAAGSDGNQTGIRFDAPVDRLAFNAGNGRASGNGRPHPRTGGNGNGNGAAASKRQVGFLLSLARRKRNFSAEQTREWLRTERQLNLNALSKSQAAALIDELNVN